MSNYFSISFCLDESAEAVKQDLQNILDAYFSVNRISGTYRLEEDRFFMFRSKWEVRGVRYEDILYFECRLHRIELHTHQEIFSFYKSMADLEKELDSHQFIRVHHGFLVNRRKIHSLQGTWLTLRPGKIRIPISKSRLSLVQKILGKK